MNSPITGKPMKEVTRIRWFRFRPVRLHFWKCRATGHLYECEKKAEINNKKIKKTLQFKK